MALFTIKSSLRHKLNLSLNKFIVISERHLRGRVRSEVINELNEKNAPKFEEELFDHEIDFKANEFNERPKRDQSFRQEFYDSRRINSLDKFERAKYGVNDTQYQKNYNQRDRFDRYSNRNNKRHQMNENYDNSYDNRRNDRNFKQNNYKNFNRNDYSDNRWQRSEGFDKNNNRYKEKKESQQYRDFKFRNQINEFGAQENAIYNVDKQFDFEDERPRFSRLREKDMLSNKKIKRFQRLNNNSNENNIDLKDIENTGEDNCEEFPKETKEKIPFQVTAENRFEVLNQIVTPLHLKPYDLQLSIKYRNQSQLLRKFGQKLKLINSPVVCDAKGLPCPLELVKPSPITERYRNKDEFSIWPGVDGYSKTLGFFIGQPSIHENVVCVEPDHIIVSRESHLSIAKKFQNYLKDISPHDSCQNYGEGGHWRRFHIRSNTSGQHMISAIMHPQELTQQELNEEMQRLRDFFEGDQRISSMYFQASRHTRLSNEKEPYIHLLGDPTITETLSDKKFIISVDSFFQINTRAAEVLYRNVMSELNFSRNTTVLDICCGTGALATLIAPNVCRVIGIDSSVSAINDAKRNAALNGVTNTTFIAGPVEQKLPQLMDELYSQDIVVVANPTRAGLHSSVINALREINFIRKVVYVSCKPEGNSFKNFIHLCVPANKQNKHLGPAFVPTNAIPVDMFPHTNHCELILTFERF